MKGNYSYAAARVKAKRARLLSRDSYPRVMAMSIPEISRFVGELEYGREIAKMAERFSGFDLLEAGTYSNMAHTFRQIIIFCKGDLREMMANYLRRWDIWNIKTVLRGKSYGASAEEIKITLVPAGELRTALLYEMAETRDVDKITELLSGTIYEPALKQDSIEKIENELDRTYYKFLLRSATVKTRAGLLFRTFVKHEIDAVNLKTLIRLKYSDIESEKIRSYMLEGGHLFGRETLKRLAQAENWDAFVTELRRFPIFTRLESKLPQKGGSLYQVIREIERWLLETADAFSHLYPVSVLPILSYILRKETEVNNLRIIARGKESGLEEEVVKSQVIA